MTGPQRSAQTRASQAKQRANAATSRDPLSAATDLDDRLRQLNALIGNQAVAPILQGKLGNKEPDGGLVQDPVRRVLDAHGLAAGGDVPSVSHPDDTLEREADRVAEMATRDAPPNARGSTDSASLAELGVFFGRDFGRVRIHTDVEAAQAARALGARAFTVGSDIFLGAGEHASSTHEGRRLLTHELTHVVHNTQAPARGGGGGMHVSGRESAPGAIARAVTPNYSKIESNLTYSPVDWAITDIEALEVMMILAYLSDEDLTDTVKQMEADGLVVRLLENITEEDRTTFPNTVKKIQGARSVSSVKTEIEDLMSYGLFDWAITDEEAHRALETLKDLSRANPAKFKQVVRKIEDKYFQRFLEQVSDEDRAANKEFLEDIRILRATGLTREDARNALEEYAALFSEEDRKKKFEKDHPTGRVSNMLRALAPADAAGKYQDQVRELLRWTEEAETRAASGMSDEEMAKLQSEFMAARRKKKAEEEKEKEKKATPKKTEGKEKKEEGKPAADVERGPTEEELAKAHQENVEQGSIPETPESEKEWQKVEKKPSEVQKWEKRADRVIATLVKHINKNYPELSVKKENFRADFKAMEERGQVYAFGETTPSGVRVCVFGMRFVEAAEADPEYVVETVVHELSGHPEFGVYGTEYHLELYDAAAAKMKGYKQPTDPKKREAEIDTFAYQGTEIYSVLRAAPYEREVTPEHKQKGILSSDPGWAVQVRVQKMREQWHPKLARALARGLYQRYRNDPRITPASLKLYEDAVRAEFGEQADAILK